jgi:protoheme IX farnesyltransferase
MVLMSSGAAYLLGSAGSFDPFAMLVAMLGIALVAGGTSALNQVVERDVDGRMNRTRSRPLPTGRVTPGVAAVFSLVLAGAGVVLLALAVNGLTALLAAIALASYVLLYTPLKRVSSLSTIVGAVPGALPIMGGWTAATGELGPGAWALFGILFFWQLPHFLALAWLYREDYARGGLRVLSVEDPTGTSSGQQSVLWAAALVPTSLLPAVLGLTGPAYAVAALTLSIAYLVSAVRFAHRVNTATARRLFGVSLLYLPLVLGLLAIDRGHGTSPETAVASTDAVVSGPAESPLAREARK